MTLEEHYRLSFYQPEQILGGREHIMLTCHTQTGRYYVRKKLKDYNLEIYQQLKSLQCDFFPKICELIEEEGTLILVEEYVSGKTLDEVLLESGTMTMETCKAGMLELCRALELLHTQNPPIIHRDIKPSNVICTPEGHWKLIDFNTARYFDRDASRDTTFLGTREYAAPEQFGDLQTDVRTDIYELGAMMNYLLTGKNHKKYIYPGVAEDILRKCTQFRPTRRYQTVAALERDLRRLPGCLPQEPNSQEGNKRSVHAVPDRNLPGWRRWLPPGFRTGKIWKMILAIVIYPIAFYCCLTMDTQADGEVTRRMVIADRGGSLLMFLTLLFFWFNYGNIQKAMLFCRKQHIAWKILGYVVWSAIIFMAIMTVVVLFAQ